MPVDAGGLSNCFQYADCSRVALKAIRSAITFIHLDDAQSWLRKALVSVRPGDFTVYE